MNIIRGTAVGGPILSSDRLEAIEAVVDGMFEMICDADQLGFYEDGLKSDEEIEVARELIEILYMTLWENHDPLQVSMDTHW